MLINLIENAIKYNKPGGSVTVHVFGNDREANLTISDTGIGIPEEHLAAPVRALFTAWTRAVPAPWAARAWALPSSSTSCAA